MKYFRKIVSVVIVLISFGATAANAFVVDFENFIGSEGIPSTFINPTSSLNLDSASPTFRLMEDSFGGGGITFSGGIILQDPVDSSGIIGNTIIGDGGRIYYGTAFSPSTSINTTGYQNPDVGKLVIDIATTEMITSVQGSFVHGLNTDLDGMGISVGYTVNYYLEGMMSPLTESLSALFTDGDEVINFGLSDTGGALITGVEILADGYDFTSSSFDVDEFDFLLGSVIFNGDASPVPVPAALPLFISALLGGYVIARPRRSS